MDAPPSEPPAVPSPELPPSPQSEPSPEADMPSDLPSEDEMGVDMEVDAEAEPEAEPADLGGEPVSFKQIQKLTGKLTQKMRDLDNDQGMTSEDIKYVINMVLSAADLKNLSEEDKEDILSKFEDDEMGDDMDSELEGDDMGGEDLTDDSEVEKIQADMDVPVESEMGEESISGAILDSIFSESKIDRVISKYFELSDGEKIKKRAKITENNKRFVETKMRSVRKLTETVEQELASQKFLEENNKSKFIGKTNKNNLLFVNEGKKFKISPEGLVL
jgi:organic radical activating enzyme